MELTKDESKRILRRIELEAYSALVTALRAQGELDRKKRKLLRELGEQLSISTERHRAEIRRAISDDRLSMIAECVCGSDASVEWALEGRRVVPLMPRLVPQTAFTGAATAAANHAASANANISSTVKSKVREQDDDAISRKRQRTTSPKPVQKVIMSSLSKASPQKYNISTVATSTSGNTTKDTNRYSGPTNILNIKQENTTSPLPSVSMKIARNDSAQHKMSSKPVILGGTKQSSTISMASTTANRHVAPLPASCLQAHASVVNNKNKATKLNLLKQKPKPKFKPITSAAVKVKSISNSTINASQSTPVFDTSKGVSVSSVAKLVQAPRTSSSITLSPKSSLSPLKNTLQMKLSSKSQSPPGVARALDTTSRTGQQLPTTTKITTTSRLSRPLPVILPKALPPKPAVTRRLTSILPAPPKTLAPSVNKKVILPSTVSSSPPVAIVSSSCCRPPQALHSLSNTVKPFPGKPLTAKIPAVSLTSGAVKRDSETCSILESRVPSTLPIIPNGSSQSSSSKPKGTKHEREVLSPVSEILTLVTSPSSVPFVSPSPVKSQIVTKATTGNVSEVSLRCEETLSEVKNIFREERADVETFEPVHESTAVTPSSYMTQTYQTNTSILETVNTEEGNGCQVPDKQDVQITLTSEQPGQNINNLSSEGIDLSPLVDELLINISTVSDDNNSEEIVNVLDKVENSISVQFNPLQGQTEHGCDKTLLSTSTTQQENQYVTEQVKSEDIALNVSSMNIVYCPVKGDEVRTGFSIEQSKLGNTKKEENELKTVATGRDLKERAKITNKNLSGGVKEDLTAEEKMRMSVNQADTVVSKGAEEGVFQKNTSHKECTKEIAGSGPLKYATSLDILNSSKDESESAKSIKQDVSYPVSDEENKTFGGECGSVDNTYQNTEVHIEGTECPVTSQSKDIVLDKVDMQEDSVGHGSNKSELQHGFKAKNDNVETKNVDKNVVSTTEGDVKDLSSLKSPQVIKSDKMWRNDATTSESTQSMALIHSESQHGDCSRQNELLDISTEPLKPTERFDETNQTTKNENSTNQSVLTSTIDSIIDVSEGKNTDDEMEMMSKDDKTTQQDSGEEQFSSSDNSSCESGLRVSSRKRKAPPPRDLSIVLHPPSWIRGALHLLQRVSRYRGHSRAKGEPSASSWFIKPVEAADAPGYHRIIKNPMDFGTIKTKLETVQYIDRSQFHKDMLLVRDNCHKYNPPGHDVRRDCDEVFMFYEAEYGKCVEKLEKSHLFSAKRPRTLSGGNETK